MIWSWGRCKQAIDKMVIDPYKRESRLCSADGFSNLNHTVDMIKASPPIGQKFHSWQVISEEPQRGYTRMMRCQCECGEVRVISLHSIKRGDSKSCGCRQEELYISSMSKHGVDRRSRTTEYKSWLHMIERCENRNCKSFPNYGGRGITVCTRWRWSFHEFIRDMGPKPKGYTIERIDVDGDYFPENCKWASKKEQSRNRRNVHRVQVGEKILKIHEWSEISGVSSEKIYERIFTRGWEPIIAIFTK